MPKADYDAGREAGVHQGRRLAQRARRWTDLILFACITVGVVVIVQFQSHEAATARKDGDARVSAIVHTLQQNSYEGCKARNKIVERQVRFYREDAELERTNRFVDALIRNRRVEIRESAASDVEAMGIRDCSVYLDSR